MKLHEEFKLYENLWEADTFPFNDAGEYIGPTEKCNKCGGDCASLMGTDAIKTPFGTYCTKCYVELDKPEFRDDALAYSFSTDCGNSDWIEAMVELNGSDYLVDLIQAWNKAKKDTRFVLADKVAELERKFIASAKKCGFDINPRVFTLNTVTMNDIVELKMVHEKMSTNNDVGTKMKITKSELKEMIREALREELGKSLKEATTKKIIYVLTTFDNEEIIFNDFDEAVEAAEAGEFCGDTKRISAYYQDADGSYHKRVPNSARWTEEEGIIN